MDFRQLFRTKSLTKTLAEADDNSAHGGEMARNLKLIDLIAMGIAAIVGAGIFSTISKAAYDGGPGVVFLFIITAVTCGFTALCYAEFASRVPVAGSAYTYSYVTFGELIAWIIGWALILEYAIGNIVVAISWSSYFNDFLMGLGIFLPKWLISDPGTAHKIYDAAVLAKTPTVGMAYNDAPIIGGMKFIINLPAACIVVALTCLAYVGMKETKRFTNGMVLLKLAILFVVIAIGIFYVNTNNWHPFMPNGFGGVMKGVSSVFFAYIGFDAISTTAEECQNPQRDLPRGMIYSLIICTVIYSITALVITGMVNYKEFLGVADPLAYVFGKNGLKSLEYLISVSAIIATASVLLVFQIGQPRIWMSMSRDGLLPKRFGQIHPKYKTPGFATIVTGFLVAVPSLFMDPDLVTDLTSIGTLFAFVLVCGGVLLLKEDNNPNKKFNLPYINGQFLVPLLFVGFLLIPSMRERLFSAFNNLGKQPYEEYLFLIFIVLFVTLAVVGFYKKLSLIPVSGVLCCAYLLIEIPENSWYVFFGWMALGLAIYFSYGFFKSKLAE